MVNWKNVPKEIKEITIALSKQHPPTNPRVLLRTAEYWLDSYSAEHPFYKQTVSWLHECAGIQNDLDVFEEFINELKKVKGDADDR